MAVVVFAFYFMALDNAEKSVGIAQVRSSNMAVQSGITYFAGYAMLVLKVRTRRGEFLGPRASIWGDDSAKRGDR